jgi:hypothetical protein
VVTALLWAKGAQKGKTFDYKLWFSDVYVRTFGMELRVWASVSSTRNHAVTGAASRPWCSAKNNQKKR